MNILVVLAGQTLQNLNDIVKEHNINYIVAVDGGYDILKQNNVKPDLLIGDLDSIKKTDFNDLETIKLNEEKDDTDFEYTINYLNNKYSNCYIYIVGFMSFFRIEHFYANLKLIKHNMCFLEQDTEINLLTPGEHKIDYKGYVSFFAHKKVTKLTLNNFKYSLKEYILDVNDTLCISNEIIGDFGEVKFEDGQLIIFKSKK